MKQCYSCKIEKDESYFFKDAQKKDRLSSTCKECRTEEIRKAKDRNPETQRIKKRYPSQVQGVLEWREKNKKKVKAIDRLYRAVRSGKVHKPSNCECCNSDRYIKGLILDDSSPFDVIWLCSKCHSQYYLGTSWRTNKIKNYINSR